MLAHHYVLPHEITPKRIVDFLVGEGFLCEEVHLHLDVIFQREKLFRQRQHLKICKLGQ